MPDEIPLQEIARQIVKERFYHALVRCWHYFRHNNPAFRKAEQQALNNPDSYEQHKKELRDIVDSRQAVRIVDRNQPAKIIDFSFEYPLAILDSARSASLGTPRIKAADGAGQSPYWRKRLFYPPSHARPCDSLALCKANGPYATMAPTPLDHPF